MAADDRLEPLTVAGRGIAVLIFVQYHDGDGRTARALGMSRRPLCTAVARMTAELDAQVRRCSPDGI